MLTHAKFIQMAKPYFAPKPSRTWKETLGTLAYWAFPLTALWGAFKKLMNLLFGKAIGKLVLQAQGKKTKPDILADFAFSKLGLSISRLNIKTHDGALLDCIEIKAANNRQLTNKHTYIIHFLGNQALYENALEKLEDDVVSLNATVIGFNFRGTGESRGQVRSKDHLIIDGIAQVQRLIDQGADPEKIYLKGHSLGAGIATMVAKHFHDRGVKINLFNGRSFSNITNTLVGVIRSSFVYYEKPNIQQPKMSIRTSLRSGHKESQLGKLLGSIAKPFISLVLKLTDWEIEAAAAFHALPATHKEYMLVRSKQNERSINSPDDSIITHYASLHTDSRIKKERRKQKQKIQTARQLIQASASPLITQQLETALDALTAARYKMNERKMQVDDASPTKDGHNIGYEYLYNQHSKRDANAFFKQFVLQANAHHENARPTFK